MVVSEFKDSLVYRVSSRRVRTVPEKHYLEKTKKKKKRKKRRKKKKARQRRKEERKKERKKYYHILPRRKWKKYMNCKKSVETITQ